MMFDECPSGKAEAPVVAKAVDRTLAWAKRCVNHHAKTPFHFGYPQALFGIVQGGIFRDLRQKCARELVAMDCPGYAIGGLAVGEPLPAMYETIAYTAALLPENKPRYLMGVGTPQDILEGIERGIDMFDCVLPTRIARNGTAFTAQGTVNLKNSPFIMEKGPIEEGCSCPACVEFSRGYLRHLIKAEEILGLRLVSLHNLHFYLNLMRQARTAIETGVFGQFRRDFVAGYKVWGEPDKDEKETAR